MWKRSVAGRGQDQTPGATPLSTDVTAPEATEKPVSRAYAHYVLLMLCLANTLAVADRTVMSLLLEPIKADLHASDTAMSLLTGAAFVLFYSLFGIPIARWADRGNRRSILALGIAVWSVATGACGVASNFAQMAIARAGVGMGESSATPTSLSLIADYYRREVRPQMVALFNLAVPIGSIIITPLLGVAADQWGWRTAFFVLAVPGVIVALLVQLTVREPRRGAMDVGGGAGLQKATLGGALKDMWNSRPFMLILIGTAIVGLGAGTLGAWGAAVMVRAFHVTPGQVAAVYAPISAVSTFIGTLAGGFVITWVVKRFRDQRLVVLLPALISLITVPGGMLFAFGTTWAWTIFGGILGGLTIGFRTSPYQALMLDLVPANCRGMAAAASVVATSVVGFAGGPLVVGMISDALAPELGAVMALRRALIFAPVTLLLGCIPFFMALRYFDADGVKPNALRRPREEA